MKISLILSNIVLVSSENIYNYYELAVQKWCSSEYMIHGLWPQINNTSYPEYCKEVSYIEPSDSLLHKIWYGNKMADKLATDASNKSSKIL